MIKRLLSNFFSHMIFPPRPGNWYDSRGYVGENKQAEFAEFLSKNSNPCGVLYEYLKDVNCTRYDIDTVGGDILDAVFISPILQKLQCSKRLIIFFNGRAEYYESRFRDMAMESFLTNSCVLGFNHRGVHASSGLINSFQDLVDDAISIIRFALDELAFVPEMIILQGNSLGAAVQAVASDIYRREFNLDFRQINSNSFSSLPDIIAARLPVSSSLHRALGGILRSSGWGMDFSEDFFTTGIHRMVLRRYGDRTILPQAEFFSRIDIERDCLAGPEGYAQVNLELYNTSLLIAKDIGRVNPHIVSLHRMVPAVNSRYNSVFDLINLYITSSDRFWLSR